MHKTFSWLEYYNLKANASKCHIPLSPYQHSSINITKSVIKTSNCKRLLAITISSNFTFRGVINKLCRNTTLKLHVLFRISQCLSQHQKRILFKTFINLQFNYCPLVWRCHSRGLNTKINDIHNRSLQIVYQDKKSTLQVLLQKDKSVPIHTKNLQYLAAEIYKVKNCFSLEAIR